VFKPEEEEPLDTTSGDASPKDDSTPDSRVKGFLLLKRLAFLQKRCRAKLFVVEFERKAIDCKIRPKSVVGEPNVVWPIFAQGRNRLFANRSLIAHKLFNLFKGYHRSEDRVRRARVLENRQVFLHPRRECAFVESNRHFALNRDAILS
jgi:hypothetical protein